MTPDSVPQPNRRLTRIRLIATGILALMAGVYVFSRSYEDAWPWLEWSRAFAEAGMVGGLADWFAVTALFRHPLGLPIPHTAVIPREKDRIGNALARFVRGNFLTSERICRQITQFHLIRRMARWMTTPEKSTRIARQTLGILPTALDSLEKHNAHRRISSRLIEQLRTISPQDLGERLLDWLMADNRYRQVLPPFLAQLAEVLHTNKNRIEQAAADRAPLQKIPLLGKMSKALAEDISERATGSAEQKLLAASRDDTDPLWDLVYEQLATARDQLSSHPELGGQLETMRDQWLNDPKSSQLAERLWQQLRTSLDTDLKRESPHSVDHLASIIASIGSAIDKNPGLARRIETILIEATTQILDQHGQHLETMIRNTIEEWDPDTLMEKLEHQVGPDLQYIRINGTLIGGLVGVCLHALGKAIW